MRPKKRILLVSASEERLSMLRFMLATHAYAVTGSLGCDEALAQLLSPAKEPPNSYLIPGYDLLLCYLPLPGVEALLARAHTIAEYLPTLLVGAGGHDTGLYANAILTFRPSSLELLDRVKVMSARKRGPHTLRKPPVVQQLIVRSDAQRLAATL